MATIKLILILLAIGSAGALCQTPDNNPGSSFVPISLPRGVKLVVPKGWKIFGQEWTDAFKASAEAAMDLSGVPGLGDVLGKQLVLFAANSVPAETYASIRVSSIKPPSIAQGEIAALNSTILKSMEAEAATMWKRVMAAQKLQFLGLESLRREMVSGHLALVTEYRRSSSIAGGPVRVQISQIITAEQEIMLTLSYRESEAVLWSPVLAKVRRSLEVRALR